MMDNHIYKPEDIKSTAFFTGHRHLRESDKNHISDNIFSCINDAYQNGYRRFFCGCALGFDTIAAFQTIRLRKQYPDVILSLAVPCATQPDRWQEKDRIVYDKIMREADEVNILSPVYYQGAMLTRNRFMADRSSLCICYLVQMHGGTASAVRYASLQDRIQIINLALSTDYNSELLREKPWNFMFISPSAGRNAVTVPLSLISDRKLSMKRISI